jgi:hypothetical protein
MGAAYCFRKTPVGPADLLSAFVRPGISAAGAGIILFLFTRAVFIGSLVQAVVLHALLFAIAYIAVYLLIPGGREEATDLFQLGRDLQKLKRSPA